MAHGQVIYSGYQFRDVSHLKETSSALRELSLQRRILGTIYIAPEGINFALSGTAESIEGLKILLAKLEFNTITTHERETRRSPFSKLIVREKSELLPIGIKKPSKFSGQKLNPHEFKKFIEERPDFTLLDARNDYEVKIGKFKGAKNLPVKTFREFVSASKSLPSDWKRKPLLMYCTGGIRCEKISGIFMEQFGFSEVYELDGGILRYLSEVDDSLFEGDCVVFDGRASVSKEKECTRCVACGAELSEEDLTKDFHPFRNCFKCSF